MMDRSFADQWTRNIAEKPSTYHALGRGATHMFSLKDVIQAVVLQIERSGDQEAVTDYDPK